MWYVIFTVIKSVIKLIADCTETTLYWIFLEENLSKKMRSLLIFSVLFILIIMTQSSLGGPSCLDDNTVYFGGYNLVNPAANRKNTSMECQLACQYNPRCQYWSWMKKCAREGFNNWWCEIGRCHLYSTKQAPGFPPATPGHNSYYVSGSKYCTHVS